MKAQPYQAFFKKLVENAIRKKHIYGAVFYISSGDHHIDLISSSGNMQDESRYYIASINKLFVSALIFKLISDNKLNLHDQISGYLSEDEIKDLHYYKGEDYSRELKIIHLLSLTSGLPGYLIDKQPNGKRAMKELETGIDQSWPIRKVVDEIRKMKTHFPPGMPGKAKYNDTNHQLLSLIIEKVHGIPVKKALNSLFKELKMSNTFVYEDNRHSEFIPFYYKSEKIQIPLFLASTQNDIISTAKDQMIFIRAFFNGYFYPKEKLKELEQWNNIFFPFKYGIGIQKFYIPPALNLFRSFPDVIGHSGSTGSVAFYVPKMDLYITGTVNQQAKPSIAFRVIVKMINKITHQGRRDI